MEAGGGGWGGGEGHPEDFYPGDERAPWWPRGALSWGQPRLPHPDPGLNPQVLKPGAASLCQALRPEGERAEREMGAR